MKNTWIRVSCIVAVLSLFLVNFPTQSEAEESLELKISEVTESSVSLSWEEVDAAEAYHVYWADKNTETMEFKLLETVNTTSFTFKRSTHVPHYFKVAPVANGKEKDHSNTVRSEIKKDFQPQLEDLDRGLVAVSTDEGVFLSWRLMKDEVNGYSETGLTGVDFVVYRDGTKLNKVTDSTNYLDKEGRADSEYQVQAVLGKEELETSTAVTPWEDGYYDLPLQKPEDGVTPAGETYTYHANDMSVGDVNGDGQYEFVVKWEPSNSKDVSQKGYTGNTYIDTYTFEGELLYRIDLGVNIRSGAHYTQFLVYDFDGDGKAEMMFKTAPGTKIMTFDENGEVESEEYITMPQEDIERGYSHQDDYRMSADDYYQHVVEMFKGWHEHEEVVAGNWPETLEESFGIDPEYEYPLSQEDAEALTDYFINEYAPSRSDRNDLTDFEGFIVEGPEYLTVFEGETGQELETIHYKPGRTDDGLMWGDYAMSRIEPGNRVDRFLGGVAYLDGENPYAVFARGYYTRTTLVSYDWDGESLNEHWYVDSGWTPMSNPFNDGPHGVDGTDEEFGTITTQGAHSLSVADVDGDGKHEIIYGGATIDHDGSLLYSSFDVMPPESADPGAWARLGHGDALHVADVNPDRPGLESFMVFEGGQWAPYGYALRDAETGEVIYGGYTGRDTGRGMVGDVNPEQRGLETWAVGLWTADGEKLSDSMPGTNFNIKWSGDLTTQIVNGAIDQTPTIDDWQNGRMLVAEGTRTNNYTKGTPSLVADIFGDFREELLVRTEDSSAIRIYINTDVTEHKLYTLMHDIQYRTGIAWQNVTYNQPSYPSFYYASDMDWAYVPIPVEQLKDPLEELEANLTRYLEDEVVVEPVSKTLFREIERATAHAEAGSAKQVVKRMEVFKEELNKEENHSYSSPEARQDLSQLVDQVIKEFAE
ncbi:FIMAH domain-containing protein [Alkalicoccobacillus porphyridii]|uniref:rhamnogalacturonan lyase family protein n=1 Tax=Alkalicoccobacillus porphyridii TaxID=2597270 RepID=UPI00163D3E1E|nr:rhamnogalacturonan lyase [Alkalicoccobacillus porphyridii]